MPTPAFSLEIRASRILRWGVAFVHLLAFAAPWLSALPIPIAFLLSLVIALHGIWQWRGLAAIEWRRLSYFDGAWRLVGAAGELVVRPKGEVYVSPYLVAMSFETEEGRTVRLLLLPDSGDRDELRRLRVWLRLGIGADAAV